MYTFDSFEYKGYKVQIVSDAGGRIEDFDMLGIQAYWHSRMNLGHDFKATSRLSPLEYMLSILNQEQNESNDFENIPENEIVKMFEKTHLVIPVYAYEHGGITIKAGGKGVGWDSFDSGQLGFIYVSHDKIRKEYQVKRLTKSILEKAKNCLLAEVQLYDDYLTGNVWGYQVLDQDNNHLDSCYGFFGDSGRDDAADQAKGFIDWQVQEDEKESVCYDQRMTLGYSEA